MSWASRTGKTPPSGGGAGGSGGSSAGSDVDFRIIEEENNFPFASVDYIRIGSAHAVERNDDREALKSLLSKYTQALNTHESAGANVISYEEKF